MFNFWFVAVHFLEQIISRLDKKALYNFNVHDNNMNNLFSRYKQRQSIEQGKNVYWKQKVEWLLADVGRDPADEDMLTPP